MDFISTSRSKNVEIFLQTIAHANLYMAPAKAVYEHFLVVKSKDDKVNYC